MLCVAGSCYYGDGRYYVGDVNVTSQGIPCQAWEQQSPHEHTRSPQVFPTLKVRRSKSGFGCTQSRYMYTQISVHVYSVSVHVHLGP